MIIRVYAMFDRKALSYGALLAFVNDEVARRTVVSIARGDQGEIRNFPGDFDVMYLGRMDTDTGQIAPEGPSLVFNVGDLLKAQEA